MKPEEAIEELNHELLILECLIEEVNSFICDCDVDDDEYDDEKEQCEISLTRYKKEKEVIEMAISAIKEVQQYRAIGTVEECREAVEKQKPKAPKDSLKIEPVIDENGAYVDADVTVYLLCPSCGEMIGIDESCDKFCRECGQAIDENLEGMEE